MHFSWLFTTLASAAVVNASVLPDVFKPNQIAARNNVWPDRWNGEPQQFGEPTAITTITVTEVVAYVQTVVEQFQTCSGQLETITEIQVVVQLLVETHTTISQPLSTIGGCDCVNIGRDAQFTDIYSQVYVVFQAMVEVVTRTWADHSQSFTNPWSLYSVYFSSLIEVVDTFGVNTGEVIQKAQVDVDVYASIGIHTWASKEGELK